MLQSLMILFDCLSVYSAVKKKKKASCQREGWTVSKSKSK